MKEKEGGKTQFSTQKKKGRNFFRVWLKMMILNFAKEELKHLL